MHTRTTFPLTE